MLFNSPVFIFLFLPIVVAGYYCLLGCRKFKLINWWLIVASLFFYGYWNVGYVPLLLGSVSFNYIMGQVISVTEGKKKKYLLFWAVALNLLLLGYFKYADFLINNVNWLGEYHIPPLNVVLPLAISFFTFQQIAYLTDSYNGKVMPHTFLEYLLFVCFFPQLIAGPIVNYVEMMPQFAKQNKRRVDFENIFRSLCLFLIGLFKKAVIADYFAFYVTNSFDATYQLTCEKSWATSLAYTMQIYFDFSGYCDMAMGIAGLFNIKLPLNFNAPYKALNIQDFWRRWHITLSRFLLNYLYIPLGGSRKGEIRTLVNVAVVFLLGGLWHGAAWNFVIWGGLHGLALIIYRLWLKTGYHLHKFLAWFLTFNFVNIAWVFFRAKDLSSASRIIKAMFDFSSVTFMPLYGMLAVFVLGLIIFFPHSVESVKRISVTSNKGVVLGTFCLMIFSVLTLMNIVVHPYTEFIYFNF